MVANIVINPTFESIKNYQWNLPEEVVSDLGNQSREILTEDLIAIIRHYITNKGHILDDSPDTGFPVIHAVFLLAHFKIEEGLEIVLELWSQDDAFLNNIFGDIINEDGWYVLYHLGKNKIDLLTQFILDDSVDAFSKAAASNALSMLARENDELRDQVYNKYEFILDYFNTLIYDEDYIDEVLIALIICDVVECEFINLYPKIKTLYDKEMVDIMVTDEFDQLLIDNAEYGPEARRSSNRTVLEVYKHFDSIFNKEDVQPSLDFSYENKPKKNPDITTKQVGRNEPCPCGSGKKYKKCCG